MKELKEARLKGLLEAILGVEVTAIITQEEETAYDGSWTEPARITAGVHPSVYDKTVERRTQAIYDLERAENVSIYIQSYLKELAPAEVGDFVLVFSPHDSDEEMHVAIVTSKITSSDGVVAYGASFLTVEPNDYINHGRKEGVLHLTHDHYGGHPAGFYKVISKEEALKRLKAEGTRKIKKLNEHLEFYFSHIDESFEKLTTFEGKQTREEITEKALRPKQVEDSY